MDLLVYAISFLASCIGSICGLGGGIIIKPVMDAVGSWGVSTVNLLAGCVVLAMSAYSVILMFARGKEQADVSTTLPIAIGAAAGGLIGKQLFSWTADALPDPEFAGTIQAAILFVVTVATLLYTIYRDRFPTYHLKNPVLNVVVGLGLGAVSTFLGIGGGPINLAVFFFLYSMDIKEAARNSLFVILFSQAVAVAAIVAGKGLAGASVWMILGMIACGIAGGIVGRSINKRIDGATVNRLFIALMAVICGICVYNMWSHFAA